MRAVLSAALLFVAAAALAGEDPPPDYSRDAMFRMFGPSLSSPRQPGRVQWHAGYVEFRALHMNWRFSPLLAPLPGARLVDAATVPNPFALTGTRFASTLPPMFDSDRSPGVEREYRRIQRLTKKRD